MDNTNSSVADPLREFQTSIHPVIVKTLAQTLTDALTGISPSLAALSVEQAFLTCSTTEINPFKKKSLRKLAFAMGRARRVVERAGGSSGAKAA